MTTWRLLRLLNSIHSSTQQRMRPYLLRVLEHRICTSIPYLPKQLASRQLNRKTQRTKGGQAWHNPQIVRP